MTSRDATDQVNSPSTTTNPSPPIHTRAHKHLVYPPQPPATTTSNKNSNMNNTTKNHNNTDRPTVFSACVQPRFRSRYLFFVFIARPLRRAAHTYKHTVRRWRGSNQSIRQGARYVSRAAALLAKLSRTDGVTGQRLRGSTWQRKSSTFR